MTDAQKVECVEAGLGKTPTAQELAQHLHGRTGKKMTKAEEATLLEESFKGSPNEWQLKVISLIQEIPSGCLISYGSLARWANERFGLKLRPLNTAWLRREIYWTVGHDTDLPIHRIATQGDTNSTKDHPITQRINKYKRSEEGSFHNPKWLNK